MSASKYKVPGPDPSDISVLPHPGAAEGLSWRLSEKLFTLHSEHFSTMKMVSLEHIYTTIYSAIWRKE